MQKTFKVFSICLLLAAVYFGSAQMGSGNEVFASAMLRCCNNGMCHDELCSYGSSVKPCLGSSYSTTCRFCMMEEIYELKTCGLYLGPTPTWCILSDGSKLYGD